MAIIVCLRPLCQLLRARGPTRVFYHIILPSATLRPANSSPDEELDRPRNHSRHPCNLPHHHIGAARNLPPFVVPLVPLGPELQLLAWGEPHLLNHLEKHLALRPPPNLLVKPVPHYKVESLGGGEKDCQRLFRLVRQFEFDLYLLPRRE